MKLIDRVNALEGLTVQLADRRLKEFGDVSGHEFHGNQWTSGGRSDAEKARSAADAKNNPVTYPRRAGWPRSGPAAASRGMKGDSGLSHDREAELRETYGVTPLKNGNVTTEIDVTGDTMAGTTAAQSAQAMAEAHSVTARLLTNEGPSGWPVYHFDGSEGAVLRLLNNYDEGTFP